MYRQPKNVKNFQETWSNALTRLFKVYKLTAILKQATATKSSVITTHLPTTTLDGNTQHQQKTKPK